MFIAPRVGLHWSGSAGNCRVSQRVPSPHKPTTSNDPCKEVSSAIQPIKGGQPFIKLSGEVLLDLTSTTIEIDTASFTDSLWDESWEREKKIEYVGDVLRKSPKKFVVVQLNN